MSMILKVSIVLIVIVAWIILSHRISLKLKGLAICIIGSADLCLHLTPLSTWPPEAPAAISVLLIIAGAYMLLEGIKREIVAEVRQKSTPPEQTE